MRLLFLLAAALVFSGCESFPERLGQRFAPPTPKEEVYEHEMATVFAAAQQALQGLDYQITRTAQAQGILNGQSRLLPTERFGRSDQYVLEVRLRALDGDATSVAAVLYEVSEGEFVAGGTSTPIREHGRYASFFETLNALLPRDEAAP